MAAIRPEDLTPFGRLALKLDAEFRDLGRAAADMDRLDVETDGGLDEGLKILSRVAASGEGLAAAMQQFGAALQEARDQAEASTRLIAGRATLIQKRSERQAELQERLTAVKDELQSVGANLAGKPAESDKARIAAELERLLEPMTKSIEAAQAIKTECAAGKFRRLERQADSVIDSSRPRAARSPRL
ncbi:MAG: hypothetical protein M0D55_07925 [Elusimicrobiota bacterium]|nr:MAG: hypothetical protein M0D55_07925 [Elusimicrobiota bacterium]